MRPALAPLACKDLYCKEWVHHKRERVCERELYDIFDRFRAHMTYEQLADWFANDEGRDEEL